MGKYLSRFKTCQRIMRKITNPLIVLALIFNCTIAFAAIGTVEERVGWRSQIFIASQIKGIGLVDSYQEDNSDVSYVYDNALAAMASMLMGNFGLAEEILNTLSNEVQKTSQGVPAESYLFSDRNGNASGLANSGNCAWLLQALNIYQKLKGGKAYYATQKKLADFLISLQDIDGGIRGNYYEWWKSTEHNIIAYSAIRNFGRLNGLSSYIIKAERIKDFIKSPAIWKNGHFNRGKNDTVVVTDTQSLGVLLLGSGYSSALNFAEANLRVSASFNQDTVTGFDFNNDRDTVWIEGTLQMALAYYKTRNYIKGALYSNEAMKVTQPDGSLILATNRGTANDWWMLEPWRSIAPTCWLIFYRFKFSPLILY